MVGSMLFGTLPQWISAAAAIGGLCIAFSASKAWKNTLHGKRGDDLLAATFDLVGEVGATVDAIHHRVSAERYGAQIDRLFRSLRTLQKSFVIAGRSYPLEEAKLVEVRDIIQRTIEQSGKLHTNRLPDLSAHEFAENSYVNVQREVVQFRNYVRQMIR